MKYQDCNFEKRGSKYFYPPFHVMSFLCAIFFILITITSAHAATVEGKVIKVTDGDTLTILTSNKQQMIIRLSEIDAPESGQAFGQVSKRSLAKICFGKKAKVTILKKDYYGRYVGRVICDGIDANKEQVKQGMAWVYDKYVTDMSLYEYQKNSCLDERGLWSENYLIEPWKYRKGKKQVRLSSSVCSKKLSCSAGYGPTLWFNSNKKLLTELKKWKTKGKNQLIEKNSSLVFIDTYSLYKTSLSFKNRYAIIEDELFINSLPMGAEKIKLQLINVESSKSTYIGLWSGAVTLFTWIPSKQLALISQHMYNMDTDKSVKAKTWMMICK